MNYYPNLPDVGFLKPSNSGFNLSWTTIITVVLALLAGGYFVYRFIWEPFKSKDLELQEKKVDPLKVMVNRELAV